VTGHRSISGHTPCPHTVEACFEDHPARISSAVYHETTPENGLGLHKNPRRMRRIQRPSGFAVASTCVRNARSGRGDQALA
jgi:hypothetical protein